MKEIVYQNQIFKETKVTGYYISNDGKVLSLKNKKNNYQPYLMKSFENDFGYLRIELKLEDGTPKKFNIHRLVYETWVGELKQNMVIEHLDSNPKNNFYLNLKQSSQKENIHTCIKQNRRNAYTKQLLVYNKQENRYYIFNSVKDLNRFVNINGDSLRKFFKNKNRKNIFNVQSLEDQSTIETFNFTKEVKNGVEYLVSESLAKEVYNN